MQPLEFSEIHDVFRHGRELVLIIKQLGAPLAHKTLVRYVVDAQPLTAARAACPWMSQMPRDVSTRHRKMPLV